MLLELKNLTKTHRIGVFENKIDGLLRGLGIDCWAHTEANIVIDVLDVFGRWPVDFRKQYAKEEFYRDDLVLRHLMHSDQPIFLHHFYEFLKSAPIECGLFSRNRDIETLHRRHGTENTFSIPIVNPDRRAIFTVSSSSMNAGEFESLIARNLSSLKSLAELVDNIGHDRFMPKFHGIEIKKQIPLNVQPLKLLDILATKDLSLNEAAEVLNISISTANQHIAAAKKAFGTTTTHGTVIAAVVSGYIVLDM